MKRTPGWKLKTRGAGLDFAVVLGVLGAMLFFGASSAIAYINIETIRRDEALVTYSHEVMLALQKILATVQDAETGQRGYLLTNNPNYLAPYNEAVAQLPAQLATLAQLTEAAPAERERLGLLEKAVATKLAELKETVDLQKAGNPMGALAIVNTNRGKEDMDAVRAQLNALTQLEESARGRHLAEAAKAKSQALVSSVFTGLVGLFLTVIVAYLVNRAAFARRRQEWFQTGQVGLEAVMRGDQPAEMLGRNILGFMAEYLGSVAGALYVAEAGAFTRIATYGVPAGAVVPERFYPGEGLLGEAVAARRRLFIDDVPEGYLSFGSALGRGTPRHLLVVPGMVEDEVNTVLELGFIHNPDENLATLLGQMLAAVAMVVRSAKYRDELKALLEDTQRKSEALQVQGEELRVSNEELEEQSRALKESQARLEQQQAELNQTNAQLEEQAQQLETQGDDLAKANALVQMKIRELEQASRYKSDFLANMSHELRTPLNSLLILAKLLGDNAEGNLSDEQIKYAQTIQSAGNDLLVLINDILDLSKIEAGHVDIAAESVPLPRLAASLEHLFLPIAQKRQLGFETAIDPECPPALETDPQKLEQILKNLLSNAFKFTEAGRVSLTVKRAAGGRIAFSVADTGIGIPEDQQKRIFEAFHQADGTISRRYGGTGLGLSISRELARLLGGSIHLRSQPGTGSVFTLILPEAFDPRLVAPRDAEPASPAAMAPLPAPPAAPLAPMPLTGTAAPGIEDDRDRLEDARRVLLIVEDDARFAQVLRDLAREAGFKALLASTAEEALQLARQFMPHAVILDVGLPDQSGLSVLDRLKRDVQTRHIPIHVVSAADHAQTALSLGAVGYLLKPVQREELTEALRKLETRLEQRMHRVLIVEDDALQREAVSRLLAAHDTETVSAGTAAECLELLKSQTFDCMVLDLSLPDASGYSLLETLSREDAYSFPPVIVYTGRELTAADEQKLRRYSKSIIIKGAKSPERLLDEVTLFLHQVVAELPPERQKMIRKARNRDALLEGRRILIVEDDIRNVYALTNILEPRGAAIEIARNGQEALDALAAAGKGETAGIDLVLMDVMMPVMDGLTAIREIRKNQAWRKLPIIALTAKAMPDDQQRCIEAGANDYMAKPLDVEKLLSLVRVWMPR
ncbi:response regulator [Acidocella sp.]|uniref:response regulator n=1 Tax=Acidocella sp. TaxID=50710 RepID=UPI00260275C7|nr:response regulator [Acidocella sp.]